MTAVNGAVVWSAKYSSFGEANVDPASTVENNLRFSWQYDDGETGLHYNFKRFYDPETGRYLTTDSLKVSTLIVLENYFHERLQTSPLNYFLKSYLLGADLLNQSNPSIQHQYIYGINSPVNLIDPHGQLPHALVIGGIAGLINGGITLALELAEGKSLIEASKAALISGGTTAFSAAFASLGGGIGMYFLNSMMTSYTNAALQTMINCKGDVRAALFSGFALSPGQMLLSQKGINPVLNGVISGLLAAPVNFAGSTLF